MKFFICICLTLLFQKTTAQNYIEWGLYGCGITAATNKNILLENGKSISCSYNLKSGAAIRNCCETGILITRLQQESLQPVTAKDGNNAKSIFALARQIAAVPKLNFSPAYCDSVYKININSSQLEFNRKSGKTKKEKQLVEQFIYLLHKQ